jgi:hypothetical protein
MPGLVPGIHVLNTTQARELSILMETPRGVIAGLDPAIHHF